MTIQLIAFMSLILSTSNVAFAAPIPEMIRYLEDEISILDDAVAGSDDENSTPPMGSLGSAEDRLYFTNFWLRIRPKVGFSLPALVKVEINLETEILWQKVFPEGWEAYQPKPKMKL